VMIREVGVQPAFEPLDACEANADDRGFEAAEFAPVEHWVSWQWDEARGAPAAKTASGAATALEARALALNLRRLHDEQKVAWSDVGVLFRAMSDLDEYLAALRELGVPYAVERDRSYYRRREIIDASALVRCVLDPNDTLAMLTFLRSPAVGVPDAALIPLFARDLPARVADLYSATPAAILPLAQDVRAVAEQLGKQGHELPGIDRVDGWESNAIAAFETLAALRESFEYDAADVFVERMRALHLGEVAEASRYLGSFRAANLERFHRELLAELAAGEGVEPLLRRLRSDVATAREAEEEGPKTAELDAVRVMTIHRAKGLDFEHVYVMQLHKGPGRAGAPREEVCLEGRALEYRLFGTATLGFEAVRARRAEVEAVERVRTLYVAMTRAKRRVVLSGRWNDGQGEASPEGASSPVDLLRARRGLVDDAWRDAPRAELEAWMIALAAEGERCWRDVLGVRFGFPAFAEAGTAVAAKGPQSAGLPSEAVLLEQSRLLQKQREQAKLRMQRPWQQAASALVRSEDPAPRDAGAPQRLGAASAASGDHAAAAGTAVHRVFEELDLTLELAEALEHARRRLPALLAPLCAEAGLAQAEARANETLDRFEAGPLFSRFAELRGEVVARELQVWLPPPAAAEGPVAVVSGVIDLVYRDAASGQLVVVDYKTDRVEGAALEERAAHYSGQGGAYVDALAGALELEERPRFELWFLHAGQLRTPTV
jgi:ATP-dependent helicase/nuclease subunit A